MPRPTSVEVELDRASARERIPAKGTEASCDPALEIDARVRVRSADGTLDDGGDATIVYRDAGADAYGGVQSFGFGVDYGEHGGDLSIVLAERESARLDYQVHGVAESCEGRVMLTIGGPSGDGGESSVAGVAAVWSESGCGPGYDSLDLEEPLADCRELERVEVQLGLELRDGAVLAGGGGLEVFEYHRVGNAAPGAADRVRRLSLR